VQLRPYQTLALDQLRAKVRAGARRVLLVAPTGAGKTEIMREMIRGAVAKGNRSLVIAHRRDLVTQTRDRFAKGDIDAGIIMAGHPQTEALTQVGSIQTLSRRMRPVSATASDQESARGDTDSSAARDLVGPTRHPQTRDHGPSLPEVKILVIDEAHHAKAKQYEKLIAAHPDAVVVGLTASPWRLDGRGLGDIFGASVVAATPRDLIRDGYLCGYAGYAFQAPDLTGVRTIAGDWDERGLSLAYQKSTIYADIIEKWSKHAKGRQTIVFAASIENSREIAGRFGACGIATAHLDHTARHDERKQVLDAVRLGATRVICNAGLLGEGIDVASLSCAVLARPTKSLTVYLQQVGRVMRPKADGSKALILDHAGNVERHGLPDAERDYSLTTTKPREVVPALFTCPQCFAISEHAPCPECGHQPAAKARSGPVQQDEHVEVEIGSVRSRDQFKRELVRVALERGYSAGWVVHRFLQKFPGAPKPWGIYREVKEAQT
jgi:DNA repair protein RadD